MLLSILTSILIISCVLLLVQEEYLSYNFLFLCANHKNDAQTSLSKTVPLDDVSKKETKNNCGIRLENKSDILSNTTNMDPLNCNRKKELDDHLKHLEFILAFENQLKGLGCNGNGTIDKLERFMLLKQEVQLKTIQLSQIILKEQLNKNEIC